MHIGRRTQVCLLSTPSLPPKTTDQYPQKSPQGLGYTSRLIAQVLPFDGVWKAWCEQPFGCSQKPRTFYTESGTYKPYFAGRGDRKIRRKERKLLKIKWLLR